MTTPTQTTTPATFWRADDLRVTYGERDALSNVSLELRRGDVLAVVGPSGAGKTTLLRALNFLEPAQSGVIHFAGDVWPLRNPSASRVRAYRRRTGFVFQDHALFLNRTALGNVVEALRFGHGIPKAEAHTRARSALEAVGIGAFADRYPSELSGGQRQRAAIARALAPEPDLLFLDEPTSALDPESRRELLELLRRIARAGRTMIIVTHDIAFAAQIATKAAFLEQGRIVETAPAEAFFRSPQDPRTAAFLATEAVLAESENRAAAH